MRNTHILFLILLFQLPLFLLAQDIPFDRSSFGKDRENLRIALRAIRDGDSYYMLGQYNKALESYQKAQVINPNNSELNYMIGYMYLYVERYSALPYMKKAYELNPGVRPDVLYLLGLSYHYNEQFEEAKEYYAKFQNNYCRVIKKIWTQLQRELKSVIMG